MKNENKKILVIVNKPTTIVQFRLEVVAALVKVGYEVYVSVPDGNRIDEIEAVGAKIIITQFDKDNTDPIKDISLMHEYKKIMRQIKPDLVLTYTIKPNVYGGMAAAALGIPYVANITGLGIAFEKKGAMQNLVTILYKYGFRKINKVFFQNSQNRSVFESKKIASGKHFLLPGSGVNLEKFHLLDYPEDDVIHFAFISRIRKEKGIEQYIDTARYIKAKYPNTCFHVCGYGDEEHENRMRQLHNEGLIVYHGLLKDTRVVLKDVHCVIHPTYYPEGMSNVLLESAASGRPIISTDRPGCREAIDDGKNGFLIKEQDSVDLIEKVEKFMALSHEDKKVMGLKGREKVAKEFDRNIVVKHYLDTAAELTGNN